MSDAQEWKTDLTSLDWGDTGAAIRVKRADGTIVDATIDCEEFSDGDGGEFPVFTIELADGSKAYFHEEGLQWQYAKESSPPVVPTQRLMTAAEAFAEADAAMPWRPDFQFRRDPPGAVYRGMTPDTDSSKFTAGNKDDGVTAKFDHFDEAVTITLWDHAAIGSYRLSREDAERLAAWLRTTLEAVKP